MKACKVCGNEFESNYKRVVTCSDPCRVERKNDLKRIHSKKYYAKNKKPKYVNSFLRVRL